MKTILLVDFDRELLESQARAFRAHRTAWELLLAENGHQAVQVLENRAIDLLFTALEMPVMDGFELMSHVLRLQPDVPVVMFAPAESGLAPETLDIPGTCDVLVKPLSTDGAFNYARTHFARGLRGHLSGISLSGALQLLHLEQRSCTVTVRKKGQVGTFELQDGVLTHASVGGLKGEEAAIQILTWRHPDLEVVGLATSPFHTVSQPLEGLLMEAARQHDESRRDLPDLSSRWLAKTEGSSYIPPFELRPKQSRTVRSLLQRVMMIEGTLGVGLMDTRSASCVMSESVRLKESFDEQAAQTVMLVRDRRYGLGADSGDPSLDRMVVELHRHIEVFQSLEGVPLGLYLLGRRHLTVPSEAIETIERIAAKISDVLVDPDPAQSNLPRLIKTAPANSDKSRERPTDSTTRKRTDPPAGENASVVDEDDPVPPLTARNRQ